MKSTDSETTTPFKVTQLERDAWMMFRRTDVIPPGFRPKAEWCAIWNRKETATDYILRELVSRGVMERRSFYVLLPSGVPRKSPHWKLIAGKSNGR